MSTQQSLTQLQSILEKHRMNEMSYKDKIKEINLTRSKISDQVQILQQTYDKKIKTLQQRLEVLKNHNEALIRENVLYKSEIDTYQSRLVEKEKIIAMLLSQRKDLPVIATSQRSKSQKTDSLNANEEQSKSFKKPVVFKQDIEQVPPPSSKFKQEIIEQKIVPEKIQSKEEVQSEQPVQSVSLQVKRHIPLPKKKATFIPNVPAAKKHQPQVQNSQSNIQQNIQQEEYQPISNKPPKPSNRVKTRKNQPINYPSPKFDSRQQIQQQTQFEANNFFSNLGKQSNIEDRAHQNQIPLEQQVPINVDQYQLQANEEVNTQNNNHLIEQTHQQQVYQQYQRQEQNHQPIHQTQEYQNTNPQEQPQIEVVSSPIVRQENNFLSHFTNNYSENTDENYQPVSKTNRAKKVPKRQRVQSLDSEISSNDFFSQLGRSQNEQHHTLQIEQSSIDHIDRDNSLMSNQQPYFAQQAVAVKKPVKMPKKKGKRDQIKMMDPSCFE